MWLVLVHQLPSQAQRPFGILAVASAVLFLGDPGTPRGSEKYQVTAFLTAFVFHTPEKTQNAKPQATSIPFFVPPIEGATRPRSRPARPDPGKVNEGCAATFPLHTKIF